MVAQIICPTCGSRLSVAFDRSEGTVLCQECNLEIPVPPELTVVAAPPVHEASLLDIDTSDRIGGAVLQKSVPHQPSGWGAFSFITGALALSALFFWVLVTLSGAKKGRLIPEYAVFQLALLWTLFLPINLVGLFSGVVGLLQPRRKQLLTYFGIGVNGLLVGLALAAFLSSILERQPARRNVKIPLEIPVAYDVRAHLATGWQIGETMITEEAASQAVLRSLTDHLEGKHRLDRTLIDRHPPTDAASGRAGFIPD